MTENIEDIYLSFPDRQSMDTVLSNVGFLEDEQYLTNKNGAMLHIIGQDDEKRWLANVRLYLGTLPVDFEPYIINPQTPINIWL